MRSLLLLLLPAVCLISTAGAPELPFNTAFKGRERSHHPLTQAYQWKSLPLGERTATIGRALCGTPYKGFTLEIDDHIEAPSVNFNGLDCWTFFETSLSFSRM